MNEITIDSFTEINPGSGNRLKLFLELIQKTPGEIAEEIDMPDFTVLDIQAERTPPNIPLLNLLINRYHLGIKWLITGNGEMFSKGDRTLDLGKLDCSAVLDQLRDRRSFEGRGFVDFWNVEQQLDAKRGLEIAAAGYHHLLIAGPSSSGKTMLLKALPSIMPDAAEPGGGGLLFADELEYRDDKFLLGLRPLLDNEKWMLAAAVNIGDDEDYPMLPRGLPDRFDIKIKLGKLQIDIIYDSMKHRKFTVNGRSPEVKKRVTAARRIQRKRFKNQKQDPGILANAQMNNPQVLEYCMPDTEGVEYLQEAAEKLDLTARGFFKVMKLSRTIADLEASPSIEQVHVAEAVKYNTVFSRSGQ